ncbi:MAG: hypothetical protein OHK0052_19860 [Anaerolineales bacterium]
MTDGINFVALLLTDLAAFLPKLLASLVLFVLALFLSGFLAQQVTKAMQRHKKSPELAIVLARLTRLGVLILGITMALQTVGFDLTAFLAGLGILGFTVGFALQDVSKNFVAGLLLLLEQPFNLGDFVEVGGFSGTVQKVHLRATEMITLDGNHVLIPNADVFSNAITNYTRIISRRLAQTVGVAYGSDLEKVRRVTLEAIGDVPGLLQEPQSKVIFETFNDSSIDFTLYYWIDAAVTTPQTAQDAVVTRIKAAFEQHGIEIPFPIRTVLMPKA